MFPPEMPLQPGPVPVSAAAHPLPSAAVMDTCMSRAIIVCTVSGIGSIIVFPPSLARAVLELASPCYSLTVAMHEPAVDATSTDDIDSKWDRHAACGHL